MLDVQNISNITMPHNLFILKQKKEKQLGVSHQRLEIMVEQLQPVLVHHQAYQLLLVALEWVLQLVDLKFFCNIYVFPLTCLYFLNVLRQFLMQICFHLKTKEIIINLFLNYKKINIKFLTDAFCLYII